MNEVTKRVEFLCAHKGPYQVHLKDEYTTIAGGRIHTTKALVISFEDGRYATYDPFEIEEIRKSGPYQRGKVFEVTDDDRKIFGGKVPDTVEEENRLLRLKLKEMETKEPKPEPKVEKEPVEMPSRPAPPPDDKPKNIRGAISATTISKKLKDEEGGTTAKVREKTDAAFKCQFPGCNRTFKSRQTLNFHMKSHRSSIGEGPKAQVKEKVG